MSAAPCRALSAGAMLLLLLLLLSVLVLVLVLVLAGEGVAKLRRITQSVDTGTGRSQMRSRKCGST